MGTYVAMLTLMLLALAQAAPQPAPAQRAQAARGATFDVAGNRAMRTLLHTYYTGNGSWRACSRSSCAAGDADWGDDSMTAIVALRQSITHNQSLLTILRSLANHARSYPAPCATVSGCQTLSDEPEWDAVALTQEYLATHDSATLAKAEAAYQFVAGSHVYNRGACPEIPYQKAGGGNTQVKTLESQANLLKAALLLYRATNNSSYLGTAIADYTAARAYFLEPSSSLYTTYVFDDGSQCSVLPHRFFASVNGDMIWAGVEISRDTGEPLYLQQAKDTANAVRIRLSDNRGVFADLQAENDVGEPLVEGMYALATHGDQRSRHWLTNNAAAALSARTSDGSFGRFFDGPPPSTTVTIWQTNGGLALEVAAAAVDGRGGTPHTRQWGGQHHVSHQVTKLPASLTFRGSGIALLGTLGEHCCTFGHARVIVDGHETYDQTGIWQNKSSGRLTVPNTIMFAWRWRAGGRHTLRFLPGATNPKEGASYLHLVGYELLH